MTYQDIAKANEGITPINLKGKDYAMVSERVTAFRKLFPDGVITTEIVSIDAGIVLMKATAGYYNADGGVVVLGTGYAQEEKGKGMVNGTSYIENCETSAVGRALGFIGLGPCGGGICSAEELVNAVTAQNQVKQEQTKAQKPKQEPKTVKPQAAKVVPEKKPEPEKAPEPEKKPDAQPVTDFLKTAIKALKEKYGVSQQDVSGAWNQLINEGIVPFKSSADFTLEEAENLIQHLSDMFAKKE